MSGAPRSGPPIVVAAHAPGLTLGSAWPEAEEGAQLLDFGQTPPENWGLGARACAAATLPRAPDRKPETGPKWSRTAGVRPRSGTPMGCTRFRVVANPGKLETAPRPGSLPLGSHRSYHPRSDVIPKTGLPCPTPDAPSVEKGRGAAQHPSAEAGGEAPEGGLLAPDRFHSHVSRHVSGTHDEGVLPVGPRGRQDPRCNDLPRQSVNLSRLCSSSTARSTAGRISDGSF